VFSAAGFRTVAATALLALTSLVLGACAQSALSAPQAPPREVETRVLPLRHQREIPRLIAPPPAYGNKVVMGQVSPLTTTN
jgi:hypothetical protein